MPKRRRSLTSPDTEEEMELRNRSFQRSSEEFRKEMNSRFQELYQQLHQQLSEEIQETISQKLNDKLEQQNEDLKRFFVDTLKGSLRQNQDNQTDNLNPIFTNNNFNASISNTQNDPIRSNVDNSANNHFSPSVRNITQSHSLMKLATFDGTSSWTQYEKHFTVVAKHNGWSEVDKASFLAGHLRGKAQTVLENLSLTDLENFEIVRETLNSRFNEQQFSRTYFNELHARVQGKDENLSVYAEDIDRLTKLAYPSDPPERRDRTACLQFIQGINNFQIEFALRSENIETLSEAFKRAKQISSIQKIISSKKQNNFKSFNSKETVKPTIFKSGQQRNEIKFNQNKKNLSCYNCGKLGHISSECWRPKVIKPTTTPSASSIKNRSNFNPNFQQGNRFKKSCQFTQISDESNKDCIDNITPVQNQGN